MPLFFTSHQALVRQEITGINLNALDKWYFKNIRFDSGSWVKTMSKSIIDLFRGTKSAGPPEGGKQT